ncbi:MAG: LysM peptidoglycan-binding domain-containing protein [Bacteroidota bacterium]
MNKLRQIIILLVIITGSPALLMSQEIEKSDHLERIDGKIYYLHTIKQGQTLYSLSKVYGLPVDELVYENPDAKGGLAIGQVLNIPFESRDEKITDDLRKGEFRFIFHIVKKGQTLYGISRIYDITAEELKGANPEWTEGLKPGQYLKIPLKEAARSEHKGVAEKKGNDDRRAQEEKKYFEHTVASKETLYGIARKYRISIDSLMAFNLGLTEDIFPGEVVRIPVSLNPENFITHKVRKKTKLKRVASKYTMSVTDIKEANPGTRSRVYPGDMLIIPVGPPADPKPDNVHLVIQKPDDTPPEIVSNDSIRCYEGTPGNDKEYRIALMIPLYAEEVRDINIYGKDGSVTPSDYRPFNFIQFYEGFMMALEELKAEGLNVRLYVYDVDEKVSKTIKVLQEPELSSMDLIIGPFFSRNFKLVSNFAEMFDIKIVNPLTRRAEVLNSPNVFKLKPSHDAQPAMLAGFVKKYHRESKIILVRNNKFQYARDIKLIKSSLQKVIPSGVKVAGPGLYDASPDSAFITNNIDEVIYASDSIDGIIRHASILRNNLVIVLTDNEIFAPEILTRLNDLKDTFDITVVGMPEWDMLTNLETDYLLDLNVYFFSDSYYDYDDAKVQAFINGFRSRYKTHPDNYAFEAYDLASFFLGAMMRFGTDCVKCLPYYQQKLLKTSIRFAPANPSGYENLYWNLCRYRNYQVEKVDVP